MHTVNATGKNYQEEVDNDFDRLIMGAFRVTKHVWTIPFIGMSKQEWRQVFLLPGKNTKQTSHCKSRIHTPSKQLLFPTINKEGQALACILEHKTKSNPSTLVIKAVTKLYETWHHNEKLYTSAENEGTCSSLWSSLWRIIRTTGLKETLKIVFTTSLGAFWKTCSL